LIHPYPLHQTTYTNNHQVSTLSLVSRSLRDIHNFLSRRYEYPFRILNL